MQSHTLTSRHAVRSRPPVGRGGKRGKTSGRGGKGQTARAGHKMRPQARDIIKKFPKRRGYGKNRARTVRSERVVFAPVSLARLEAVFAVGEIVSPETLLEKKIVRAHRGRAPRVKILGTGTLTKALRISRCAFSASAKVAVEKAGGTINA